MTTSNLPPWASGPAEILQHGLDLLGKDSDSNRRLAMISIDNSVELTIKTYLGLPKRVNGLKISRTEYQEFAESFPKLLDALENYGSSKLGSLDLGEIEWYHRLRNQLYHQGNGLTVERAKVEVYGQLAVALFENLFGIKPLMPTDNAYYLLAEFIKAWSDFERAADDLSTYYLFDENTNLRTTLGYAGELHRNGYLSKPEYREIKELWKVRNQVVHGKMYFRELLTTDMVDRLEQITRSVKNHIEET
jgi:tetratricopeptide (TPR) repeat protein